MSTATVQRHHFHYWKPEQVAFELKEPSGRPHFHTASDQFGKVQPGDILWTVTFESGRLKLVARLLVDEVVSLRSAKKRMANPFPSRWHAFAVAGTEEPARKVDISAQAMKLRFDGVVDRLPRGFAAQSFQSMRRLTPESARLIEDLWRNAGKLALMPEKQILIVTIGKTGELAAQSLADWTVKALTTLRSRSGRFEVHLDEILGKDIDLVRDSFPFIPYEPVGLFLSGEANAVDALANAVGLSAKGNVARFEPDRKPETLRLWVVAEQTKLTLSEGPYFDSAVDILEAAGWTVEQVDYPTFEILFAK
jgi:hypothetical protein